MAKKVAVASGAEQYNLLQNNGRLAHQVVDHVGLLRFLLVVEDLSSLVLC